MGKVCGPEHSVNRDFRQERKARVPSLDQTKAFRQEMFDKSFGIIEKKGADYNRHQQLGGDTLYNLRVCEILGIVSAAEIGILVRLSDKFMRLISLAQG